MVELTSKKGRIPMRPNQVVLLNQFVDQNLSSMENDRVAETMVLDHIQQHKAFAAQDAVYRKQFDVLYQYIEKKMAKWLGPKDGSSIQQQQHNQSNGLRPTFGQRLETNKSVYIANNKTAHAQNSHFDAAELGLLEIQANHLQGMNEQQQQYGAGGGHQADDDDDDDVVQTTKKKKASLMDDDDDDDQINRQYYGH
eukprot:UN01579